jgi:hypothetical protein
MFKRLAKFRFLKPRRIVPGLGEAIPANDNLLGLPGGQRRIPSPALVCHCDGGTQLGCRWQPETPAPTALDSPDSERKNNQTSLSQAIRLGRHRDLPTLVLTVGA